MSRHTDADLPEQLCPRYVVSRFLSCNCDDVIGIQPSVLMVFEVIRSPIFMLECHENCLNLTLFYLNISSMIVILGLEDVQIHLGLILSIRIKKRRRTISREVKMLWLQTG